MSTAADLFLNIGSLTGRGMFDITNDSANAQARPGSMYFCTDAFGPKIMQYVQNQRGSALSKGACASYGQGSNVGLQTISNQTGTLANAAITTGLTAGSLQGFIAVCDETGKSAAPQGEATIVSGNSTTNINYEPKYIMSAAHAANDDVLLVPVYSVTASAAADNAYNVAGVVLNSGGIGAGNWGWVVRGGKVMAAFKVGTTATAGHAAITDVATVATSSLVWLVTTQSYTTHIGILRTTMFSIAAQAQSQCLTQLVLHWYL